MTDRHTVITEGPENEYRIFGPPGCGKTSYLSAQVEHAWTSGREVLVCSLTKTAAAEVISREVPIPTDSVGTLHSHCFRSLGHPKIAEDPAMIEEWNEQYPQWRLNVRERTRSIDEDNLDPHGGSPGDDLMGRHQIHRARRETHRMPPDLKDFADAWTAWKQDQGIMDFTDLIEVCLETVAEAPDSPSIMFVDEAQDLDYLEMALIRKWGRAAGYLVIVGDPDQCLYRWRGSDPRAFSTPQIAPEQRRVLAQSYRVPRQIHQRAVSWIDQINGREPVEYYPRDEEGEVRHIAATYKYPEPALADAEKYLAQGKRVMFLTTCAYMLTPLVQALRKQGIPFHNPHRRSNGAWNPLQKRKNSVSAADRLLAWLALSETGWWTAQDARQWTAGLQAEQVLQRGGRSRVKQLFDDDEEGLSWDVIHDNFTEEAISAGLAGDLSWYRDHLAKDKRAGAEFPLTVVRQHGPERLKDPPLLTPGTVHSVKGAEADVVYLFPDLSKAGMSEWAGNADLKASVHRLFYVAMTRARESLIICQAADNDWPVNL